MSNQNEAKSEHLEIVTNEGNLEVFDISVIANNILKIQLNNKLFYDYVKNIDITPNTEYILSKLGDIIEYKRNNYNFLNCDKTYKFIFKLDIFNEILVIDIPHAKFLTHTQAMEQLLNFKKENKIAIKPKRNDFQIIDYKDDIFGKCYQDVCLKVDFVRTQDKENYVHIYGVIKFYPFVYLDIISKTKKFCGKPFYIDYELYSQYCYLIKIPGLKTNVNTSTMNKNLTHCSNDELCYDPLIVDGKIYPSILFLNPDEVFKGTEWIFTNNAGKYKQSYKDFNMYKHILINCQDGLYNCIIDKNSEDYEYDFYNLLSVKVGIDYKIKLN